MRLRSAAAIIATAVVGLGAIVPAAQADVKPAPQGKTQITGRDRYAVAINMSKATFTPGPTRVPLVVLASGNAWADGLGGASVAGNLGGPLLLTQSTVLRADVRAELQRLNPEAVMIAGGPASVSDGVIKAVKSALPKADVFRESGKNRYGVAAAMSSDLYADGARTIYIASGRDFPDALIASAPAALSAGPLLLADRTLPAETKAELIRLRNKGVTSKAPVDAVVVVGDTSAVTDAVFKEVSSIFGSTAKAQKVFRVTDRDRYSTSTKLAGILWDPTQSSPAKATYYVNGTAWADALSASAAAASNDAPVILTGAKCMPAATKKWDSTHPTVTSRVWVGGSAAISQTAC